MKKNMIVILVGVTALHVVIFSGLFASGGCKNVVMDERRYVPAEGGDTPMTVDPMENVPPTTSFRPAEPQTRPIAAPQTRKPEVPTYQPMAAVPSKPISTSSTASSSAAGGTYEVKAGDTVGKIAHQYGVSVSAMLKANNLDLQSARRLRIGQKLVIPGKDGSAAPQKSTTSSGTKKTSTAAATATLAADGTYVIKAGDTLGKIARQLGVKTADLQKANNLTDAQTRRLQIGQKLVVPGKSTRAASTTAAASSGSAATSTTAVTASSTAATTAAATASSDAAATTTPAAGTATATTDDIALDLNAALNEAANAATTTPAAGTATGDTATAISETEIVIGSSTPVEVTEEVDIETFATNNKTTVEALKKLNSDLPVDGKLKPGLILFVPAAE